MPKVIQRQQPSHDDIARLAYELWEKNAKPTGRDREFWFQAEQLLRPQASPQRPTRTTLHSGQPRAKASFAKAKLAPAVLGQNAPASKESRTSVLFEAGDRGAKP
jgi:hypothetical protein